MTERDAGHHSQRPHQQDSLHPYSQHAEKLAAPALRPPTPSSSSSPTVPSSSSSTAVNQPTMATDTMSRDPAAGAKTASRGSGSYRMRSHKNRSSGAFLLSGNLFDGASSEPSSHDTPQWQRQPIGQPTSTSPSSNPAPSRALAATPDASKRSRPFSALVKASPSPALQIPQQDNVLRKRPKSAMQMLETSAVSTPTDTATTTGTAASANDHNRIITPLSSVGPPRTSSSTSSSSSARRSLDFDSTQIVNMALSLSESRRLAAKRNISQPIPPTLSPLPDGSVGGSLKQHLQQQRRSSRNISPRPSRLLLSGSTVSAGQQPRLSSPLHASFDFGTDNGSYRYQFSQSTLARAQKAKEYMELLSQYRRVLELVPPLKPGYASRSNAAGSPPGSPTALQQAQYFGGELAVRLGREYNPLQYIRNRKVRARERKAIDGEAQGFVNAGQVTEWVNEVAASASKGTTQNSGGSIKSLPQYAPAEKAITALQQSPATPGTAAAAGPMGSAKPKRPRVDWFFNPADLLADVYWLEQEDNKKYVEDRNYKRVFPQETHLYRPLSQQKDIPGVGGASPGGAIAAAIAAASAAATSAAAPVPTSTIKDAIDHGRSSSSSDQRPSSLDLSRRLKNGREQEQLTTSNSTRERTLQQKLQHLRGLHHRHSTSVQHSAQEFLGLRKGSASEGSDSETGDRKMRILSRTQTISASDRETYERLMLDSLAKEGTEVRQPETSPVRVSHDTKARPSLPSSSPAMMITPEQIKAARAPSRTQSHSRVNSRDSASESANEAPTRGRSLHQPLGHLPLVPGSPASPHMGRESLDVPNFWGPRPRMSMEYDSSQPTSPDLRATRVADGGITSFVLPPIGKDLSPTPSRSGSPSRNPFSRVKQKYRDRNRSRTRGQSDGPSRGTTPAAILDEDRMQIASPLPMDSPQTLQSPEKLKPLPAHIERVPSPARELASKNETNPKAHKSQNSISLGREESSGLRGLLSKGPPRIDSVLRSGVSKVSELLWKKDPSVEDVTSPGAGQEDIALTTDESDAERGRASRRATFKRGTKHFLPLVRLHSQHRSDEQPTPSRGLLSPDDVTSPISRPVSRRSSRFELLKPPRLDVQAATPTTPGASPVFPVDGEDYIKDEKPAAATAQKKESARWPPSFAVDTTRGLDPRSLQYQIASISRQGVLASGMASRAAIIGEAATPIDAPDANKGLLVDQRPRVEKTLAASHLLAAQAAVAEMDESHGQWAAAVEALQVSTVPRLRQRLDEMRSHVGADVSGLVRAAADEADYMSRDLVDGQRLQVKRVVDTIEGLLRRRRRRLRWVRRAGWLAVEWWLVGFMWCVWAFVVVFRIVTGIGRGVTGAVRWLLYL